jgi:hypothetical protein
MALPDQAQFVFVLCNWVGERKDDSIRLSRGQIGGTSRPVPLEGCLKQIFDAALSIEGHALKNCKGVLECQNVLVAGVPMDSRR